MANNYFIFILQNFSNENPKIQLCCTTLTEASLKMDLCKLWILLKITGHGRILGIWELFWCPFITLFFWVRVENKRHIINIACWLQLKYMRVMQSKFTKTPPVFFQTGGAHPVIRSWIRLCFEHQFIVEIKMHFIPLIKKAFHNTLCIRIDKCFQYENRGFFHGIQIMILV